MEFLKKLDLTPGKIAKTAGLVLVALVILSFVMTLIKEPLRSISTSDFGLAIAPSPMSYGGKMMGNSEAAYMPGMAAQLSVRNIAPIIPGSQVTVGDTAEDYEVTDYSATIETRSREKTCAAITALKPLAYVIFESSNESDYGCNYSFKVEHAKVSEVLAMIQALDPKDLNESTYTIKRQLDDFTSETEILEKKRASIEATLASALRAYDEITVLATRSQDAASLAKIIDSKIQIIERLTQERININEQLDRLARAKTEQLDRLKYTYFSVSVYEQKFIDGESLADSWGEKVRAFVRAINGALQSATLGLLALIVGLIPYGIYAILLLLVAKYGWKLVKAIWNK